METTHDNLPKQIDYLIAELTEIRKIISSQVMKPEEIPKYLDMDGALNFLSKQGYKISKSKLYKCTSSNKIPYHKRERKLFFYPNELQSWCESLIYTPSNNDPVKLMMQSANNNNHNNRRK